MACCKTRNFKISVPPFSCIFLLVLALTTGCSGSSSNDDTNIFGITEAEPDDIEQAVDPGTAAVDDPAEAGEEGDAAETSEGDEVNEAGEVGGISDVTEADEAGDMGDSGEVDLAVPLVLLPLPEPALSEGPSIDDEPIPELSEFNTAQRYAVTREPGSRLPQKVIQSITDEEFEAGLAEPVLIIPDNLDPEINRPPFFENLQNLDVLAGDIVEVVFDPQDLDDELPGMFPEELPQGGSFDDNFDGSKTFRWQPLQEDAGIKAFTVVALDAQEPAYRSVNTILIRVSLPEDESLIPNVAPMLDSIRMHTVRINDPVVIEIKGIDLNGTTPILEIPELPATASFNQHPRFDEIYVLKFVPDTVGTTSFSVTSRDSQDASLTSETNVSVNVLSEAAFERSGQRLRTLASQRNLQIGFAGLQAFEHRPDGAVYAALGAEEFNIVTPENAMKMAHINPLPGRFQFAATDTLIRYSQINNMAVHGHPLVWHREIPDWIFNTDLEQRETIMREYIDRIMNRYSDFINLWDVVNEPMENDGSLRDSVWFEAMDERYIDTALHQARLSAPNAELLINEFDIAGGPKAEGLLSLIDRLQARATPLDGIGFQLHIFTSFDQLDELEQTFNEVASRDLDIYITEFDVSLDQGATLEDQAELYRRVLELCLDQPRCKAFQMWGFTDQYSFRSVFDPLLFDRAYQAKPAYFAIQDTLLNYPER